MAYIGGAEEHAKVLAERHGPSAAIKYCERQQEYAHKESTIEYWEAVISELTYGIYSA